MSSTSSANSFLSNIGLGYSIAIALAFLFLLSTLLLSSYLCCRSNPPPPPPPPPDTDGIILPRIIFVADDHEDDNRNENSISLGLAPNVINSYPRFSYTKDALASASAADADDNNVICSICLCEYKNSEILRMMPECRHFFHLVCLDAWLKLNGSCPVCRNSPLPTPITTPISTPLQEVAPLSRYAADRRRSS